MSETKTKTVESAIKMLPGFIASARVRCGKPTCRCSRGTRHLAYYHVTYSHGLRIRKYVRRTQVAEVRAACEAHKALQAQLRVGRAEYRRNLIDIQELIRILWQGIMTRKE